MLSFTVKKIQWPFLKATILLKQNAYCIITKKKKVTFCTLVVRPLSKNFHTIDFSEQDMTSSIAKLTPCRKKKTLSRQLCFFERSKLDISDLCSTLGEGMIISQDRVTATHAHPVSFSILFSKLIPFLFKSRLI